MGMQKTQAAREVGLLLASQLDCGDKIYYGTVVSFERTIEKYT